MGGVNAVRQETLSHKVVLNYNQLNDSSELKAFFPSTQRVHVISWAGDVFLEGFLVSLALKKILV